MTPSPLLTSPPRRRGLSRLRGLSFRPGLSRLRGLSCRPGPLVLLATTAILLSCTDPVEAPATPGSAASPEPGVARPARGNGGADEANAQQAEHERARSERAAQAQAAESLAADVAAGREDGGVADGQAPPVPGAAEGAAANPGSTEPSAFVRPVIQADVIENFSILRFALAEDVIDREPVMISSRFRRDSGPMHVFMEVQNLSAEDVNLVVGFRPASDDRRSGGVSLTIPPAPRYRTRARGNTRRAVGEWVCEVMDEHQRVLVTQRFFIIDAAPPSTDSPN